MTNSTNNELCSIQFTDYLPKNVAKSQIKQALNRNQSETVRLASMLELTINARIMLTGNVDVEDRLVNVQLGTVKHIQKDINGNDTEIFVGFNDCQARLKVQKISKDIFVTQSLWVIIERSEGKIRIRLKKPQLLTKHNFH